MNLLEFLISKETNGFHPVAIETDVGVIQYRYYHSPHAQQAVIFLGGAGGDWDSPARRMYPRISEELKLQRISSLRVNYRHPTDIGESVLDVLAGIIFLRSQGISSISIVGHALGGAVALQTAAVSQHISGIIAIAPQTFGSEAASKIYNIPLLLLHGSQDEILPYQSSLFVHTIANGPKEIRIYEQAGHNLNEVADKVYLKVHDWLIKHTQSTPVTNKFLVS